MNIEHIPELSESGVRWIRLPPEVDVAVTNRVLALLDTPGMQRLRHISQLGLVSQVYPGAQHSRFEHSLGVYRIACLSLKQLMATEPQFASHADSSQLKLFLVAALLHDIGHWPYCHPIEDLRLPQFPRHEQMARRLICESEIAQVLQQQWQLEPKQVADFIAPSQPASQGSVLASLLNGPIDVDKMDYLQRDSLHAGVPYGRNFDINRLIASLCVGGDSNSVAITEKGKTAAEMMVFARYVMFSEVYWHHSVRSATAMLQRLVYRLRDRCDVEKWLSQSDAQFGQHMIELAQGDESLGWLAQSLFGANRCLYKRLGQFTLSDHPQVFEAIARRPYQDLSELSERLGQRLSSKLSNQLARPLDAAEVLIDAPPIKLEVQFKIDVRRNAGTCERDIQAAKSFIPLSDISPVVRALATDQFDNFVKRIRVFAAHHRAKEITIAESELAEMIVEMAAI